MGRLVWNRQRFVKDPGTGKRQARPNPPEAWIIEGGPELRIVGNALWERVKERQQVTREATGLSLDRRPERARRPQYLFSGLLSSGCCRGGFVLIGKTRYGCATARKQEHLR